MFKIRWNYIYSWKTVNIYIAYEINLWNYVDSSDPTLVNSLFGAVKLVKNADIDKYKYSGYGIGLDMKGTFSVSNGFGRNIIIFGDNISSSVHIDSKKKYILILGEGPTQGLNGTTLTAEKKYSINFTKHKKKFCLSLHYNGANSYIFANDVEIIEFKAKDSEIVATLLCLGTVSKDISVDNMKKTGFYGYVHDFSVDYDAIVVNDILHIQVFYEKHGIK